MLSIATNHLRSPRILKLSSCQTSLSTRATCSRMFSSTKAWSKRTYHSDNGMSPDSSSSANVKRSSISTMMLGAGIAGVLAFYSYQPHVSDEQGLTGPISAPEQRKRLISYEEVGKHNTQDDVWVIINGEVYDITEFLKIHPGGVAPIMKLAGKDATKVFAPIHPPDSLASLPPEAHIGSIDVATLPEGLFEETAEEKRLRDAREALPVPEAALNLSDIEQLATKVLSHVAYAYYASAGDDEYTHRENAYAYRRFWFRPRVLNDVRHVSTETSMMGMKTSLPIYVSPSALARLGHPGGEVNIVQAAGKEGIIQGISINASCSLDEIIAARLPGQPLMFQIYLDRNRKNSENLLRKVEEAGFNAVILTVDSVVPGNRERDQRAKGDFQAPAGGNGEKKGGAKGVAQAISGYQDVKVTWEDVDWMRTITKLPIILKGIQCVEDVEKAHERGIKAVILSNHGGRSLDFAPAPLDVLYELNQKRPDLTRNPNFEVHIDGGVRRGTDVLKALCLGAKGVGLGRPFLYGNTVWGEEGVRRVIQIMRQEIETNMRLLGVTKLEDLKPDMVRYVTHDIAPVPRQSSGI
ncbi:Cytochrome b2, mitochondrial precursor [Tulasnella sp. 419]|nr:Cytochrome b2, mitochondrial precursor [Tulasnella sp. 419]